MNIKIVKDYQEMSRRAAEYISEKVQRFPSIKLGLATGGTPEGTYKKLIEDHRNSRTSYRDVTTFNLDEYIGLSGNHPNSYRFYMKDHLFDHINIVPANTHIPKGDAGDSEEECERYEKLLAENGGIDLQILGIGKNGHIGFNEPGTSFQSKTHVVPLTSSTREANARYFNSMEEVPSHAITMGIGTIMKSREILLLVSGEAKKDAFTKLMNSEPDERFPASVLLRHPNVTIIADEAAASGLK
ncbi:glucosamine-6-phosphate deaminase [Mesobacillus foraminis]|uniref:glucosamine-6-phosphate deaminase n=1 Tax=Mesobacillus foraminis TaxID=279826 RepID=UPI0039A32E63